MQKLGHIAGDRLAIDYATCGRHGSYRLDGLMERFGPEISTHQLLRALTASCRRQPKPGAKVACMQTLIDAEKPGVIAHRRT